MPKPLERLVELAVRRPVLVLWVVALLSLGSLGLAALRLEPSSTADALSSRSSGSYEASELSRERFGDDAIVVLVRGDLPSLVLTQNLQRLLGLEGCLSGNQPKGVSRVLAWRGSPCAELSRTKPVKVVYGPGTFINSAVEGIKSQLGVLQQQSGQQAQQAGAAAAEEARKDGKSSKQQEAAAQKAGQAVQQQFLQEALGTAQRYGITGIPSLEDTNFIQTLVFDASRGARTPKARFAFLFPNDRSAMIQVRLKGGLDESERRRAIELVERATQMDLWKLEGGDYTVTGAPIVLDELASSMTDALWLLVFVAVLVMAAVLALVFRVRERLLPLALALASVACLFGVMALFGIALTLAALGVLPVLIGLAVDYAIQFQARMEERRGRRDGEDPVADAVAAAREAARLGAPTIALAAFATIVGVAVLVLPGVGSPVPVVRDFAFLLMLGIAIAYLIALTAGTAAFVRSGQPQRMDPFARSARGASELLGAAAGRAARLLEPLVRRPWRRVAAIGRGVLRAGIQRPGRVLAIALALAAAGWVIDTQADVETDLYELVPQDQRALRDIDTLERTTGIAGEIDVIVTGDDLARPEVIRWMRSYRDGLLRRYRYDVRSGCSKAVLCPALSLPELFRSGGSDASAERIRSVLDAVPEYFRQAILTNDSKTASIAFGIKLLPFSEQQELVEDMRARLNPPKGVHAELAGLPVLAAQAGHDLSSPGRRLGVLGAGMVAVGLALWLLARRRRDALLPLVPIALTTGWSALVLFATQVPLNPLSATLGTLVLAISTEFAVLLYARYRQEREHADLEEALRRTYATTGLAVLASGATAIAGFAVLVASDIAVLRDFGLVTVVDLAVALLGVLAVLPATLAYAERRRGGEPPRLRLRRRRASVS